MSRFPDPIVLPDSIDLAREAREKSATRSVLLGVMLRFAIILFELVGVLLFASHALLMDALASLADVLTSLVLLIGIKLAHRPPDDNHPFGHGRYEPLVGMLLGLFLALVGTGLLFRHSSHFGEESALAISGYAWLFPLCALLLLEVSYRIVKYAAKKTHSPALEADAIHYRIDAIASLFATVALLFASFFPALAKFFDDLGAIAIAVFMIVLGLIAARKNLNQIMDTTPAPEFFEKVRRAARAVSGVLDTEKVRIQLYGPDAHVDIDVEVDPKLSVEDAHEISQYVRVAIQEEWPSVRDVTVHIEPYYPGDH